MYFVIYENSKGSRHCTRYNTIREATAAQIYYGKIVSIERA